MMEIAEMEIEKDDFLSYLERMETWENWVDRALKLLKERGISKTELAIRMGRSKSDISKFINDARNKDKISFAVQFAKALNYDPIELIFGPGARSLSILKAPELTIQVTENIKKFSDINPLSKEYYIPIRLLKDSIAAGHPSMIQPEDLDGWVLIYGSREWMPHDVENYTCAHIVGDSMWPVLAPGDIVAIDHADREPELLHNKMVAFRSNGGVTVKWLRYLKESRLVMGEPENRAMADTMIVLPVSEAYDHIVGKVAWWWAKR